MMLRKTQRQPQVLFTQDLNRIKNALNSVQRGGTGQLELMLRRQNGTYVSVELSTNVLPEGKWLMSLRDISQRKASEETLLQVRSELLEAQRLGKIGNWKWVRNEDRPQWSPEMYRIYAQDPNQPAPTISELESMYTPAYRQASEVALMTALETGRPYEAERELTLPNGQTIWVNITVEGLLNEQGDIHALRGTAQDITERKRVELALVQSQCELRDMAAYREQEREQERKSIAREIHDELGQLLAAMRMDVSQLRQRCEASEIALEWLAEDFALRWDIRCQLHVTGVEVELDDMVSTTIFRVVQESLTNIARHAHAKHVWVDLTFDNTRVKVTIKDDGVGFAPSHVEEPHGFGLLGMQERLLAIGGQFQIESQPASG